MKEHYNIFQYSYLINFNFQYFNQHAVEVLKHRLHSRLAGYAAPGAA